MLRNKYAIQVIKDCAKDFEYAQGPDILMRRDRFQRASYDAWALDTVIDIIRTDPDPVRTLSREQEEYESVRCRKDASLVKNAYLKALEFALDFLVAMEE